MNIKDNVMVITGGASGLGFATAEFLLEKGAKVALLDLDQSAILPLAKRLDVLAIACDVTSEESVKNALHLIKKKWAAPRVCVNCAGILGGEKIYGHNGPMEVAHFRKIIDIDLVGTFIMMNFALAEMVALDPLPETEERGVVINVASVAAYEGQIGQVAYSAAKAGVMGMTLPAAREMAQFGIRVVSIAPGVFETPMVEKAKDKLRERLLASTVFPKRFGNPKEFAKFVGSIIENPMLNGSTLPLDGAIRLPPK